jgi:ribosomal-protein-alanine N-acetyltransferase
MCDEEKRVTVSDCRKEDLAAIRKILGEAPEAAMWSEESLGGMVGSVLEPFVVARRGDGVAGFILGRIVGDEAEILNLAVAREFRRAGVGTELVSAMLGRCEGSGCGRVFLEVRESNWGGIAFYERLGFGQVGRREAYYREPVEAALVLAREVRK